VQHGKLGSASRIAQSSSQNQKQNSQATDSVSSKTGSATSGRTNFMDADQEGLSSVKRNLLNMYSGDNVDTDRPSNTVNPSQEPFYPIQSMPAKIFSLLHSLSLSLSLSISLLLFAISHSLLFAT
jgi:hypothetical protein